MNGNLIAVVKRARRDRIVRGRKEPLASDNLRHHHESGMRGGLPEFVVRRIRQITLDARTLNDKVFRIDHFFGLGQRGYIIGHMPPLFDGQALFAGRVGKGWHLSCRNTHRYSGKDIAWIIAYPKGPWLGQIARPGPVAVVIFQLFDCIAFAFDTVALAAAITVFEQQFARGYAVCRAGNLGAEIGLTVGFALKFCKILDISQHVRDLLL